MKNLIFIISISFLVLFACSSDDDTSIDNNGTTDNTTILPKRITLDSEDVDERWIEEYVYNGNKIDRINYFGDGSSGLLAYGYYQYSGNLVVRTEAFDPNGNNTSYTDYTYDSGGNIIQINIHRYFFK